VGSSASLAGDLPSRAMNAPPHLLVLGGTTEASALVGAVAAWAGAMRVTTSLAGRTSQPRLPPGSIRVGGFGGVDGLIRYLEEQQVTAVVDATHPFAARMPWNARDACDRLAVPRLRLIRPPWRPVDGDRWHPVADLAAAADCLIDLGARRVLLTTGRQELAPFTAVRGVWFLTRTIEVPTAALPVGELVLARGPFDVGAERALMLRHGIDTVVTKNSGGAATVAKLVASRQLGVAVVMVDRPPNPPGPTASDVTTAAAWVERIVELG
jgi:precorrin-6A/cobalt-precorrin-6A reductase